MGEPGPGRARRVDRVADLARFGRESEADTYRPQRTLAVLAELTR